MRIWKLAPAVCAVALLAAACGSSDDGTASGTGGTGGASGGPTGAPITIGVQAPMNGAAAFPQSGYGATAAVAYINEELGGINGRPLKIDLCAGDGSPETAISCANKFVSENVPVVFDAYDSTVSAQVPILTGAKITIVGTLGGQGTADALPNPQAYYWSGPLETSALGSMTVLQKVGAKKAALLLQESPAAHSYFDKLITPISAKLGLSVSASYTPTTNMNFSVLAATELAAKPDTTGIISLPEDGCTGLFKALRQQGWDGRIFAGSCSQFISAMGKDASGIIVQPRLWVPLSKDNAPKEVQDQLAIFSTYMAKAGYSKEESARSLYSFAGLVNLAKAMQTIQGDLTNTTVATAMSQVKDMKTFAGPTVTCDGKQWPGRPSSCSKQGIFFEVQDNGTLKPVEGAGADGYIDLDPSVIG
jgi:branched-chain amino acid transport system substrate-binding protein